MSAEDLSDLHIAELHARAAEAGINGYRMLGRDELIAEIESGGKRKRPRWPRRKAPDVDTESETDELKVVTDDGDPADAAPKRRRSRRGDRGRGGAQRERLPESDGQERRDNQPEHEETEEITGILEITRQRHGFISVEGSDDDVYVSASQVRRCEMKDGDEVTGPARAPREGERHRALVRVTLVNGEEPVAAPQPKKKKSGGAAKEGKPSSAAAKAVVIRLVSVDDDQAVIEVDGTEHELEPGDRLSVSPPK